MRPEKITAYTDLRGREVTDLRTPDINTSTIPNNATPLEKSKITSQIISPESFEKILPLITSKETSLDATGWKEDNPLWGHCAVVSLIGQDLFGGDLLRASLANVPGFEHMRSHYWNRLPDGSEIDFTKPQFGDNYPQGLKGEIRDRNYVLSFEETKKRYKLLSFNLAKYLSNNNPIFNDQIYKLCFLNALDSTCQKMKFGCVIKRKDEIVYEGSNKTLAPLKELCEPKCIRSLIQSRTEQMLGACGHAEELGLWEVAKKGIPLNECDLYIAGLYPNGLPWLKKEPEHTCLRCATQMYNAGIKKVFVPVVDKWVALNPEDAVKTALAYAQKEKSI